MLGGIALDMEPINRMDLQVKIQQAEIEVMLKKPICRITQEGVIVTDEMGIEELCQADWVVSALGSQPNNSLAKKLEGKVPELYVIGDSYKPAKIMDAAYDGFRVAWLI